MNIVFLSVLYACLENNRASKSTTDSLPSQQATNTTVDPTPKKPTAPSKKIINSPFVGHWTSPSCGQRSYERRLKITTDQKITVSDYVSPCPPNTQCMWSGIAIGTGMWKAKGDTIQIKYSTITPNTQPKENFPRSIQWEEKAPTEFAGDTPCLYAVYTPTESTETASDKK